MKRETDTRKERAGITVAMNPTLVRENLCPSSPLMRNPINGKRGIRTMISSGVID
jgi:hypothetical protein